MRTIKNILLFGSSGHCKVIIDIVETSSDFKIFGLIDKKSIVGKNVLNYKVIGTDEELKTILKNSQIAGGIIAIGDNTLRKNVYIRIKKILPNFNFITLIHHSSTISKYTRIGEGTVVMPGVVINSGSKVGKHCVINTNASIDHDNIIADFVTISPGVTTGGNVKIQKSSFIGLGTKIIQNIKIGSNTLIGANSLVLKNIARNNVAYGIPAEIKRTRKSNEMFLQ